MTISCCFYFRFLLAFTTVRSGANERFVISFMEAYFCTGNSNWIGRLDGELEKYQGLFEIAKPILCEKGRFSIAEINRILNSAPEYIWEKPRKILRFGVDASEKLSRS